MKASIIIPNLNGEGWIKDSIDSCINQDFKEEYEIIIIDNGSKDRSVEIIEECATRFKNFKIIKFRENTWLLLCGKPRHRGKRWGVCGAF